MQGSIDMPMMEYLGHAAMHSHLAAWRRHLSENEVEALQLQGAWQQNLLRVIGALYEQMKIDQKKITSTTAEHSAHQSLRDWDGLLNQFVGNDSALRAKVWASLRADRELQSHWIIDDQLLEFITRA
jgi:hypothetical protein